MQININTDWEWYENTNVFRLFTHCLLHTNTKDTRYCGREIKAGQFVSSIARIAAETGMTVSTVRTALKKLKETGYLSTESNNKYTIYTVVGYEKYIECGQVIKEEKQEQKEAKKADESQKKKCEKSKEKSETTKETSKKEINEFFEKMWKLYPKKAGKGQVSDTRKKKLYQIGEEEMQRAIQRYKNDLLKETWRKPQNGSTFFNSGYVDYLDKNYEKLPVPQAERNPASVLSCERDYDFGNLEEQLMQKQWE